VAYLYLKSKNKAIGPCLDSLGREALSQCLYIHVCKRTKTTQTTQKGDHSWPCPTLTQLWRTQLGILQSCL